jgi:hypothetical protein
MSKDEFIDLSFYMHDDFIFVVKCRYINNYVNQELLQVVFLGKKKTKQQHTQNKPETYK